MRPYVLINMAMTADGKIATANRGIESFGSGHDERNLYRLRSTVDAILCGAGTVNAPGITLGTGGAEFGRRPGGGSRAGAPLRVVVSGAGSLPETADVFHSPGGPVLVLVGGQARAERIEGLSRVAREVHVSGERDVDLVAALHWLARDWGVKRLVCEGGARLNAAMLLAGVVDELHLTVCPRIFGGRGAPTIADWVGSDRLVEATELRLVRSRRVADEMFLIYRVGRDSPETGGRGGDQE